MGTSLPIAIKAAKWWADRLRNMESFDPSVFDDTNERQGLKKFVKGLVEENRSEAQETLDPKKIKRFEAALAGLITEELQRFTSCHVGTNYDPDTMLQTAAREAGINLEGFVLPVKTRTRVSSAENEITVLQQGKKPFKL